MSLRLARTSITKHQARQIARALLDACDGEYGDEAQRVSRAIVEGLQSRGRKSAKRNHRKIERRLAYHRGQRAAL